MPDLNIDDVLDQYRDRLGNAEHELVLARAYSSALEREVAELRAKLDGDDTEETPTEEPAE